MVESGDWLVPRYQGEPFFDKPALTYWLIAASFRVFGFGTAAARLVPAIAALGVILATVWLGSLLFDRRTALAGGWMLATTFGFMTFTRIAMSDMLLALFSTLAFGLAVALFRGCAPGWAVPALGAVLGLGFQTKGPVGLLFPGLGILLLAWKRPWPKITARGMALASALLVLLGFSWFVAVWFRLGTAPLQHFFLRENLQRFAAETYDTQRSPLLYLGVFLTEGGPWAPFLPLVFFGLLRRKTAEPEGSDSVRLLLGWMGLMLIPLSVSRGKIDYYILPLYPAASLAIAHHFVARPWGALERAWARAVLIAGAAALAFFQFAAFRLPEGWLGRPVRNTLVAVALAAAVALLAVAARVSPRRTLIVLAATSGILFFTAMTLAVPAFMTGQPNAAVVADVLRERAFRPDLSVAVCSDPARVQRDLLFHARITVLERCDLWFPASSGRPFLLLLQRNERDSLRSLPEFRMISGYDYLPAAMINVEKILFPPEPQPLFLAANFPSSDPVVLERQRLRRERRERREAAREAQSQQGDPQRIE